MELVLNPNWIFLYNKNMEVFSIYTTAIISVDDGDFNDVMHGL